MWKKIMVSLIALIGTFSVVFLVNHEINADSSVYNAGGPVTGRVNIAVTGIKNDKVGMKKGDKIWSGLKNPTDNSDLGFQLVDYHNGYTDYTSAYNETVQTSKPLQAWLSFSNEFITEKLKFAESYTDASYFNGSNAASGVNYWYYNPSKLNFYPASKTINDQILTLQNTMFQARDLSIIRYKTDAYNPILLRNNIDSYRGNIVFLLSSYDITDVSEKDLKFKDAYWLYDAHIAGYSNGGAAPEMCDFWYMDDGTIRREQTNCDKVLPYRASTYLDVSEVVFATSKGSNDGFAQIDNTSLPTSYESLYTATSFVKEMKVRMRDASLIANLTNFQVNNKTITKASVNSTIYLDAEANAKSSPNGVNTLSVLVFDENDNFKYYKPLETAKGKGLYSFDTTGLPVGKYKIGIVNEVYNEAINVPASSSTISNILPLEIVGTLSDVTFTSKSDLEYEKNVSKGNTVGTISSNNGTGDPVYTLVADKTHPDDVTHFEIDTDGKTVKVKSNALNAGSYFIKIQAQDATSNPIIPLEISTTIEVMKTSATVSFKNANQTKIKLGDRVGIEELIDTTNKEITTTGDDACVYTLNGGVAGTGLTVENDLTDPKKFRISVGSSTSATLPAIFKLVVTLPDTNNYKTVTSNEKEIYVYKGLSKLSWIPTKSGDYTIEDVESGKTVGTLLGSDGIANYKYSLTTASDSNYDASKASDNEKFTIDSIPLAAGVKANVKTKTSLGFGTYKFQMKVIDQSGDVQYIAATFDVRANTQSSLEFKENGVKITTKSIYFDETNITLQAEGGESTITESPTFALSDSADSAYIEVKDNGNGTVNLIPKKVTDTDKIVKVKATKKGNSSYSDVSTELSVNIKQAKQSLSFDDTELSKRIKKGSSKYLETATAVHGNPEDTGVGGIIYTSDKPSVIAIDSKTGEVTVGVIGKATISAKLNDPSSLAFDPNFESKTITKTIEVYEGMSVSFQSTIPSLQAGNSAVQFAQVGLFAPTSNNGPVTYAISSSADVKNIDKEYFKVNGNKLQLDKTITGLDLAKHSGGNVFKVQVTAADTEGSIVVSCEVTILDAENDFYFVDSDDMSKKITELSKSFVAGSTFQLASVSSNGKDVSYQLKAGEDINILSVATDGTVTILKKGGPVIVEANVQAGNGYAKKKIELSITIYDGIGGNFIQSNIPQAKASSGESGSPIGSVNVSGGMGEKTYEISSNPVDNSEQEYISVNQNTGLISLKKSIIAADLSSLPQDSAGNYLMKAVITVTDSKKNKADIKAVIKVKGEELNAEFDTAGTGMITKTYALNGTFTTTILHNSGNGVPVYSLKTDVNIPTDVLKSIDSFNGIVTIENAVMGSAYAYIQADIPANGGYCEKRIETPVNIIKADQGFQFKKSVINLQTESSLELEVTGIKSKQEDGTLMGWLMESQDRSLVKIDEHTIIGTLKEGSTTVTASVKGDRNYKAASSVTTIHVSSAPAYDFSIKVPSAVYGDTGLAGEVFIDDGIGVNKKQNWSSSDESVATIHPDTGEISIRKVGRTTITCTQTSDGEPSVSSSATFVIDPKPMQVTVENKTKKVGESIPAFTTSFDEKEIVGNDTIDLPIFTCIDSNNKTVTENTESGEFIISAKYATGSNPNYEITLINGKLTITQDTSSASWYTMIGKESNNLIISEKWVSEPVYVLIKNLESSPYDQISQHKEVWSDKILFETEGNVTSDIFFRESSNNAQATSQSMMVKIDTTKPVIKSLTGDSIEQDAISNLLNKLTFGKYFKVQDEITIVAEDIKKESVNETSGLKDVSYKIYELDRKTGLIIDLDNPYAEEVISSNMATIKFKVDDIGFYRICAVTSDNAGNTSDQRCSDINVKHIDEDIDKDGTLDLNDSNEDGCSDLNIVLGENSKGIKTKLNVAEEGKKYPYMNIDSDGDGKANLNIDSDLDGLPDLNLVLMNEELWKPTICVLEKTLTEYTSPIEYCTGTAAKAQINIDLDNNTVPEINIDTKGDFKPHYNVTKEGETKPYLNIGPIHSTWKPDIEYLIGAFSYDSIGKHNPMINIDSDDDGRPDLNLDSDGDGVADINIDLDNDGVPEIAIDGNGDGKADYNLDPDENGEPTRNKITISEWKPNLNGEKENFAFDTMEISGSNILENEGIQIENPHGNFLPNHAIRVKDVTGSLKNEVKQEMLNGQKEKQIKVVYDIKMLEGETEIQPDDKIKVRLPLQNNLKNPKLVIKQKDGSYLTISAIEEEEYYMYETDYIGIVGIIADNEVPEKEQPIVSTNPPKGGVTTSVKGSYIPNYGIGGAATGDITTKGLYENTITTVFALSIACLYIIYRGKH